jgi:hypothetical protein
MTTEVHEQLAVDAEGSDTDATAEEEEEEDVEEDREGTSVGTSITASPRPKSMVTIEIGKEEYTNPTFLSLRQ